VPRFFICLLPRSCCLRRRSLMPLFHSGPFQLLFPNVRPSRVSCTTSSWSYLLRLSPAPCHFHLHAGCDQFLPRSKISLRRFSCAVPLLHDGTCFCRRQTTSSGIHNLLGSAPCLQSCCLATRWSNPLQNMVASSVSVVYAVRCLLAI
jgi:hypothetical protein